MDILHQSLLYLYGEKQTNARYIELAVGMCVYKTIFDVLIMLFKVNRNEFASKFDGKFKSSQTIPYQYQRTYSALNRERQEERERAFMNAQHLEINTVLPYYAYNGNQIGRTFSKYILMTHIFICNNIYTYIVSL